MSSCSGAVLVAQTAIRFLKHGICRRRVSVGLCVCVCVSHFGIVSRRLNVESCKLCHTIARDSSFITPKFTAKFERDHPIRGEKCRWGGLKLATFDEKRDITQTVQDRCIVSIDIE